ncbi:formin-like protein 3 [Rhincodon typus]|uniref:formin-like protein 3 n=1 Tax=Rhincodon typus TaxID=259920 RepID=UPI00202F8047|nr:formin-like protein 3 [Rhincodon typus]
MLRGFDTALRLLQPSLHFPGPPCVPPVTVIALRGAAGPAPRYPAPPPKPRTPGPAPRRSPRPPPPPPPRHPFSIPPLFLPPQSEPRRLAIRRHPHDLRMPLTFWRPCLLGAPTAERCTSPATCGENMSPVPRHGVRRSGVTGYSRIWSRAVLYHLSTQVWSANMSVCIAHEDTQSILEQQLPHLRGEKGSITIRILNDDRAQRINTKDKAELAEHFKMNIKEIKTSRLASE